ncbi:hypothetical protein [Terrabacter sp. C0L_2]|uniref:hypothetical protein n=1 Tax=Terrabacter sp. C0L_2 TaxID=3108389 RepID=UPI002ED685FF|nr:hypothetical protein U5C87_09195 [Terrabacter sp. C0L_2]
MSAPRWFIAAGIALIAMALGPTGHGLWWLVGLTFAFGSWGRYGCGQRARQRRDAVGAGDPDASAPAPVPVPDPSRDRHEAFPAR